MAGSTPGFNANTFRTNIRFAMLMGRPVDANRGVTFIWQPQKTYALQDRARRPYNWHSTPTSVVSHPDVQVACAVEFQARPFRDRTTDIGEFDQSGVTVTLLDEEFAQVDGATHMMIDNNKYSVDFVAPPMGLFSVTIFQIFGSALDES